jgi:hypothetical protein
MSNRPKPSSAEHEEAVDTDESPQTVADRAKSTDTADPSSMHTHQIRASGAEPESFGPEDSDDDLLRALRRCLSFHADSALTPRRSGG